MRNLFTSNSSILTCSIFSSFIESRPSYLFTRRDREFPPRGINFIKTGVSSEKKQFLINKQGELYRIIAINLSFEWFAEKLLFFRISP